MSIGDVIAELCKQGRLVEYQSLRPSSVYRPIYLEQGVCDQIVSPPEEDRVLMAEVRATLDRVAKGDTIGVTLRREGRGTDFKRLQPKRGKPPRVWELRTTKPKPG